MVNSPELLAKRYQSVLRRIQDAQENSSAQDQNQTVQLLAVSKTYPASDIETLYLLGQRCFGENYLQEAEQKMTQLAHYPDIEWHFIGHLQSNKSRAVAEQFSWLQTLHSEKLAKRLSQQRPKTRPPLNVLLQVNIDNEASKSGLLPTEITPLAETVSALPGLSLRGLMAIPAKLDNVPSASKDHPAFAKLHQLFTHLQQSLPHEQIDTLSMGMSSDLETAIAHGASLIRIGTALFGERKAKPKRDYP